MLKETDECPVCLTNSVWERPKANVLTIRCPRCGTFSLANNAHRELDSLSRRALSPRQRAVMSSAIRTSGQQEITITADKLQELLTRKDKDPLEKLDLLLLHIYDKGKKTSVFHSVEFSPYNTREFGPAQRREITHEGYELLSTCWAHDMKELEGMFRLLQDQRDLVPQRESKWMIAKLTPKGMKHVTELLRDKGEGKQGFVAMWFDDSTTSLYEEAIAPAIRSAGYEPLRIDRKEHANKIDDEIIMEIRRSRFVVADFTGQRGGVYYEAGFARGLDIPVIWTCREGDELHFDIRQYNCLFWQSDALPEFREKLHRRIEALLGHGPA